MNARQEYLLSMGRNDLAYDSLFSGIRGGAALEADMDMFEGGDLQIDQKAALILERQRIPEEYADLPSDFANLQEVILDSSIDATADAQARGEVATTLQMMMSEFLDDGEPFLIKDDGQLNQWVRDTLVSRHPDVPELDIDAMVRILDGFPPTEHVGRDYELAS